MIAMKIMFTLIAATAFTFLVSFTTKHHHNAGEIASAKSSIEKITARPELLLDINETIDSINAMLHRLSEYESLVSVNIAGTIIITNNNMQFFHFSLAELASVGNARGVEESGIAIVHSGYETHAVVNRINFNTMRGTVAYIKLPGAGDDDLEQLHQLFIHLRSSMMEIISG
jgi:hypothetical protein